MKYTLSDGSTIEKFELLVQLYINYRELMHWAANEILNDYFEAQDAVSDAFEKLLKNKFSIDSIFCNKTRTFLVIISRNAALSIYYAKKKGNLLYYEDEPEIEDGTALPLDMLIYQENLEELGELLLSMDNKYGDVISMKLIYGHSDAEIASLFGISEGAVRVRLSRGKKLLREILNRKEDESKNE